MEVTNYYIRSRHGTTYAIRKDNNKWYYDCDGAHYVRSAMDDDGELVMIDPDGGPAIYKDDFLSEVHDNLPHVKILKITFDREKNLYQLHI